MKQPLPIFPQALPRPLDPINYRTNLAILILTPLAGVLAGAVTLFHSGDLGQAVTAGFFVGASAFIAWIIAREADPEYDYSAFLASFLAVVFYQGRVDILPLVAIMMLMRVVNRIVGPPANWIDSLTVTIVTLIAMLTGYWVMGIVSAVGFLADGLLSVPKRVQWVFAVVVGGATAGMVFTNTIGTQQSLTSVYLVGVPVACLLGLFAIYQTKTLRVACDQPTYALSVQRVRFAGRLLFFACTLCIFWLGDEAVKGMMPALAVLASIGIYRLLVMAKIAR